jgi:hypothetical protein
MAHVNHQVTKAPSRATGRLLSTAERETVVRERLYNLLTTLGELPLEVDAPRPWGRSWRSALEAACPPGYAALPGRRVGPRGVPIEDLVVGPAGLVVVGHTDGPGSPNKVRETLRGAFALRAWLKDGPWGGVPVLAAVCSPQPQGPEDSWRPALMLDGLWVGTIDKFGPWLASGGELEAGSCSSLAAFLALHLGAG